MDGVENSSYYAIHRVPIDVCIMFLLLVANIFTLTENSIIDELIGARVDDIRVCVCLCVCVYKLVNCVRHFMLECVMFIPV